MQTFRVNLLCVWLFFKLLIVLFVGEGCYIMFRVRLFGLPSWGDDSWWRSWVHDDVLLGCSLSKLGWVLLILFCPYHYLTLKNEIPFADQKGRQENSEKSGVTCVVGGVGTGPSTCEAHCSFGSCCDEPMFIRLGAPALIPEAVQWCLLAYGAWHLDGIVSMFRNWEEARICDLFRQQSFRKHASCCWAQGNAP